MKQELICKCDAAFCADVPEKIVLTDDSPVLASIKDDSFMSYTCPQCGQVMATEFQTHFVWERTEKYEFYFLPEPDRFSFFTGTLELPENTDIVIGFPELKERIRIIESGLDPVVLESLKILIAEKTSAEFPEGQAVIYFETKSGDSIIFHISGIKDNEIAVIKIPHTMYTEMQRTLLTEKNNPPYAALFHNGYCSVKNIDFGE